MIYKHFYKKENIAPLILSVLLTTAFFLGYFYLGNRLLGFLGITTGVLLAILLGLVMLVSGYLVLQALFFVAAEISLIIFLAQSYCAVPHNDAGDQALKSLLLLSFIYILVAFVRKLHKIIKEKYPAIARERWSKEKFTFITLFLILTTLVIWQIYQVISPIVRDLCIYK